MTRTDPATHHTGPRYTHGHGDSVLRAHSWRTAENSVGYLLPHLRGDQSLLDVGAGPGTITADLAERVGAVTVLETSEATLELARTTFAERNLDAEFVVGDVERLALADDSFDVVHAHQVLQHLADPVEALVQMARVCRPDGLIAVREVDYHGWTWWPQLPGLDLWQEVLQTVHRANGGEPDAGRRLLAWAHSAGLRDLTVSASLWLFTDEDRRWWGQTWADRIRTTSIGRQALDDGVASESDIETIAQAWLTWADDPDGLLLMPHVELLARP